MSLSSTTFGGLITFTRGSTGTRVGSTGLIETIASGQPRFDYDPITLVAKGLLIEEARTNLFKYSDTMLFSPWAVGTNTTRVSANTILAPDGATTASSFAGNGNATSSYVVHSGNALTANTAYTVTVYAKLISGTTPTVGNLISAEYNNGTSTVRANLSYSSITLTSSWARYSITFTNVNTLTGSVYLHADTSSTSTVALWGAQLEAGLFATSYIPSTDTFTSRASVGSFVGSNGLIQSAAINVARMQYNPLNLSVPAKLLLEAAATNLVTYSEQFDNAAWGKQRVNVVPNAAVSPDGSNSADKVAEDTTASNSHNTYYIYTYTAQTYTASAYVKAAGRTKLFFAMWDGSTNHGANFDLSAGTAGTTSGATTAAILALANGWFRISITALCAAGTGNVGIFLSDATGATSFSGDGSSGLYVWGAQLEVGNYATSYIATTTASVTRSADVSSSAATARSADVATVNTLSPWFNPNEGTFFISHSSNSAQASIADSQSLFMSDGTNFNHINLRYYTGSNTNYFDATSWANSASQTDTVEANYANGVIVKHALAYKLNDCAYSRNGAAAAVDTTYIVPAGLNILQLGKNPLSQHIQSIKYYPKRITNTELQALTA